MKKFFMRIVSGVFLATMLGAIAYAISTNTMSVEIIRGWYKPEDEVVVSDVASYGRFTITTQDLDAAKKLHFMENGENPVSDDAILSEIIGELIIVEEATKRDLVATEAEISELFTSAKNAYQLSDGKKFIDEYCEKVGITNDEYFDLLESMLPNIIAQQKLSDAIGQEFCAENDIEYTKINPDPEIQVAVDRYLSDLVSEHMDAVVFLR